MRTAERPREIGLPPPHPEPDGGAKVGLHPAEGNGRAPGCDGRPARQGARGRIASLGGRLASAALVAMMLAYGLFAGGLALRRHANLGSQALDMGYADQITWNALHGHGLRFTVFRGTVGAEDGHPLQFGPGGDRDSLFAYHVELLYYPISLLYLIHAGPETLIVFLTVVLALGALPVYCIARRQLSNRAAALVFAATYLLFPSVQAANLADFHAVSASAALLLFAFYFLLERRDRAFLVMAAVCAAAKEEVGLVVAAMGLYAWLALGRRRLGPGVAGAATVWVALCFGVIIPRANGGAPSLFAARYENAVAAVQAFPAALLQGRPALPVPDYTLGYVWHLLAGTGFLALFGPLPLAVAAPAVAINGLSGSVWQHGGGAHYSSEVVPALLVAAIAGTRWLTQQVWRRWPIAPATAAATAAVPIALIGLAGSLLETRHDGILPPAARFAWPAPSAHAARLAPLLARISPDAPVSAQSNVYPHLSARAAVYVFPTINDAAYVLVDVYGTSDPLDPEALFGAVQRLLTDPRFELLAGDDGFLLFKRLPAERPPEEPSAAQPPVSFFTFATPHGTQAPAYTPFGGSFQGLLDVAGYQIEAVPEVSFGQRRAIPTIYFRARQALDEDYRLTPFIVGPGRSGTVARIQDLGNATERWYPTSRWQPGELVRVRFPPVTYGPGDRLGIGVQIGTEAVTPRLRVTESESPVRDYGYVMELAPLP